MLTLHAAKHHHALLALLWFLLALVILCGAYVIIMLNLPAPKPTLVQKVFSSQVATGEPANIAWPDSKQAAVGAAGYGITTSKGDETPLPTASVAKIIAALAILKQKPLDLDQPGPTITLTSADVALYNSYRTKGGSVVRVNSGEKITQYQALQAMLIPSANNIATSLTNWAFGSQAEYIAYANAMVADLGLKNTHVADASGFSSATVSTAKDLVLLGQEAMKNPVIAQIVGQSEATLPVAGKVVTTNEVMGQAGINGIKTGHTNESGGCFLFTATREVAGKSITFVGAIMAAPSINAARNAAPAVIEAGFAGFAEVVGLKADTVVAEVSVPWAASVPIVATEDLTQVVWKGGQPDLTIGSLTVGQQAGEARFGDDTTALVMGQMLPEPDVWWRVTHPLELLQAR